MIPAQVAWNMEWINACLTTVFREEFFFILSFLSRSKFGKRSQARFIIT